MNRPQKKSSEAKGLQQQFRRQAGYAHQFAPPVAQSKTSVPAPPVYKAQSKPNSVQQKAAGRSQMKTHPAAPPAYRPQPQPKVLQTKLTGGQQSPPGQAPRQPVAPPVYRPQPQPKVLQTKDSQARGSASGPDRQQRNHVSPVQARTVQRYQVKFSTFPYKLKGGTGVDVVKKVKGGHHVSITHKAPDAKKDTLEITGFHFTHYNGGHIFWNHEEKGGHFSHSSQTGAAIAGNQAYITDKVFLETQKVATRCGCTISDQRVPPPPPPPVVVAPVPVVVPPAPVVPPALANDAW